ncbi:MAG: DNA-protecting protein DprA [Rickettsiales bacterium]|jgi:DNA processing protein|nr:DNA-protecting protein DprA [Rickettsiales bacterium]
MDNKQEIFGKLVLLRARGIGPVKYNNLISQFGSVAAAVDALNPATEHTDSVRREMDAAARLGIVYISDCDPRYPQNLREIKNHPPVMTVRGNIAALSRPMIAMVGTRHASGAGIKFFANVAHDLAAGGAVIVSGMAMGSDTAAHNGALASGSDAATIAVLAGGADYIWPLENERLYHYICERGAIVSERPVGFTPTATNFIQRNRWIAGLSDKLILGEADDGSGSAATAGFAHGYGRPVFAVPGHPADDRAAVPNRMIANGTAVLFSGADDLLPKRQKTVKKNIDENNSGGPVLDALSGIPISESVLSEMLDRNVSDIKADLILMELSGHAQKCDGGWVRA